MKDIKKILFIVSVLSLSACATVAPWERGLLADETMAWQSDPMGEALRNHVFFSKEASSGGASAAGGGCGCN